MAHIKEGLSVELTEQKRQRLLAPNRECPFCRETEFDLPGLAQHLDKDCEPFSKLRDGEQAKPMLR